ncbi:MAG TPA: hypothetical protein VMV29_25000 [Ktedonobacterales bacterium]|nr:hypothetical protein [Ktedonobacterales bacterium]
MTFYVYENWRVERSTRATIHRANCSYCNNGAGIHPNADTRNGAWRGPFATLANAQTAANAIGGTVRVCKYCMPV